VKFTLVRVIEYYLIEGNEDEDKIDDGGGSFVIDGSAGDGSGKSEDA